MPKCIKCETVQSKLTKGKFCKKCINNSDVNTHHNESTEYTPLEDRSIIDMIKDTMVKEAKLNNEIAIVLKDQIEFLKAEIKHKNLIIENLIITKYYSQPIDTSGKLGPTLDQCMCKFDNFLLLGDFNSEIKEPIMAEFCDVYNLQTQLALKVY